MKHLYLLLTFTLSFSVYSQGIFTYNFDDANNGLGFKTAIDASESSWGGVASADGGAANQTPAAAGYMGSIGTDADPTLYPGCVEAPGAKTANAIYSQKYPNTTWHTSSGGPAKSLGLNTGKVHLSVAFQAWKITNGSNNEIEVRLQNSDTHRMISVRLQQHKVNGVAVDDQLRFVGVTYNATTGGAQKTAGLFPVGSENTTPMVLGATIDFDADTWEFWTDAPGTSAGLASTNAGLTGTFGESVIGQTVDAMTIMVKGNNGADDYFIIDQIKVSGPDYIDTVSDNTADNTSPVITLIGDSVVTVEVGSNYVDVGATANDNYDGDLSASIITTSNVDTSKVGTYTITYNVSDAAGNAAAQVTRVVNVIEQSLNPIITFEDNGILSASELVIGSLATGAIVDNPDGAGKVLRVTYGNPSGWDNYAGYELPPGNATMIGGTIQFKFKSDHGADAGTKGYLLKVEGGPNGTIEKAFAVAGDNTWEFISVDLSDCSVGNENGGNCAGQENSGDGFTNLIIFDWGGGADALEGNTFYIDDVAYDLGPIIPEPDLPLPTNSAPVPTFDESSVLNIFSDHYSNTINWSENELRSGWSNGGSVKVIDLSSNDKIVRQTNLNYQGTYWNAGGSNPRGPIDFSNYAYLNLDVWVPAYAGDYSLGIALLTSNEVIVDYTIDDGPAGWRTLTIPISDFANSEISSVDGIKFVPNPQGSIPIFYWDNLFAWGDTISVNAGVDVVICENSSLELNIAEPTATNFVELAWSSSGDGTFDNNNQLTPIYYPGPTDLASGFVNLTLTATGFGQTASDSMTLTFSQSHTLSLISGASTQNQSICEGDDIIPIIYSFGDGASSARVIGLPPGIGYTINENVLTISGALNEDISEPKIYSFTVETIAGDNDCTIVAMTANITINPSYECNNNSAKILLNGPVHVTSVDGLILTADDGKCYRLKIIQGSSIELVEVNCE